MSNHTIISECINPVDAGHTAWMLVAIAFVLLMTPGLAFFEAGVGHLGPGEGLIKRPACSPPNELEHRRRLKSEGEFERFP